MTTRKSKRQPIQVAPEKCAACLICQLRCSLRFLGMPDPHRAYIRIARATDRIGSDISFTDECDNCGICAEFCAYGSLTRPGKGDGSDGGE